VEGRLLNRPEPAYVHLHSTWTGVRWFLHRLGGVARSRFTYLPRQRHSHPPEGPLGICL
jgi:hypothetical protein